jgi:hypothetical protein
MPKATVNTKVLLAFFILYRSTFTYESLLMLADLKVCS